MRLEALELVRPEGLHLVKPRLQIDKWLRSQPVHPQASILLHRLLRIINLDQAAGPQYPQVSAHCRTAHHASTCPSQISEVEDPAHMKKFFSYWS